MDFVRDKRVAAQVIVYICAFLLALMQLSPLQALFNYATRLGIVSKGLNLQRVTLLQAVAHGGIDWTLHFGHFLITGLLAIAAMTPGVLWTGSLTPTLHLDLQISGNTSIPAFSQASKSLWDYEFNDSRNDVYYVDACRHLKTTQSVVSNCPVPALGSSLLLTGASATTFDNKSRVFGKDANPSWTYVGRSFGVGASVGLVTSNFAKPVSDSPTAYTYSETGYITEVKCAKNASSTLVIDLIDEATPISTYSVSGTLPNQLESDPPEIYPVHSFRSDYSNLCAWAARSNTLGNYIAIASGQGNYSYLNALQCTVAFAPTIFSVSVNASSHTINVTATTNTTAIAPIDRTNRLIFNTIESLNFLSRLSNTLYTSSIGDSLQTNIFNMASRHNSTTVTEDIISMATSDYFEAILDSILLSYSTSQLLIANDTTTVPAAGLIEGVKLGQRIYLLLSLILNSLLLAILLIEAARTCLWSKLPRFNHADISHVIVASSAGGAELATAVAAAQSPHAITIAAKESHFVDGMLAIGVPSVMDIALQDVSRPTTATARPRTGETGTTVGNRESAISALTEADDIRLVPESRRGSRIDANGRAVSGDRASRVSAFGGGWVGAKGGIGIAK